MDKGLILQELWHLINDKIVEAEEYIDGLIEARDGDTKSSAGDKYETSREMVQKEIDRAESRLQQLYQQKNELNTFVKKKSLDRCEPGALVQLDDKLILLGLAIGKVDINDFSILCISMGSPIGQLLRDKEIGDHIPFNSTNQVIKTIL